MPIKSTKPILVVGGAGYIGSHMLLKLEAAGFQPVVLDNLSTGHRFAVGHAEFIHADMTDTALLDQLFASRSFLAIMHFASCIEVGESVANPGKYYQNNVAHTLNLLRAACQWNIKTFIFSSSAAVYGEPQYIPIDEAHARLPTNPYGWTKLMVEQILEDLSNSDGLRYAALRYFNATGADPEGRAGELHPHETHLIPLILQAAHEGKPITIYGKDYPTADGTCIRDYVHVDDLCTAHLLVLQALLDGADSKTYNLGTGVGHSVQQVIDSTQRVTQQSILIQPGPRRPGDPAILIADPRRAMRELNWQPRYVDLEVMIKHTWQFQEKCRLGSNDQSSRIYK